MPKAQEYIKEKYGEFFRKNLKKINISNQNLTGDLDLREFPKLEELDCSNNSITELDLSGCNKLRKLDTRGNKWLQIIWRREGEKVLIQNYRWKKEWNQHQQSQPQPELEKDKLEVKKQRRQGIIVNPSLAKLLITSSPNSVIDESETNWSKIHSNFTLELSKEWKNLGFSYEEAQEWINIGFKPNDLKLCAWLRDIRQVDTEWVLNYGEINKIREKFFLWQYQQLEAQIEVLLK